jgi:hypothetical protein
MFLYRHQRQAYFDDISGPQLDSVRFSCPLDRIDLVGSDSFVNAITRISLKISLVHSDEIGENVDLLGPQILHMGVLKAEPLVSLLEHSTAAARHRLNMDMSKLPIFLDLGPFSWSEKEIKSTATCSDIEKRGQANAPAHQSTTLLWRSLSSPLVLIAATNYDRSLPCLHGLCNPVFWLFGYCTSPHRFLEQRLDALQPS